MLAILAAYGCTREPPPGADEELPKAPTTAAKSVGQPGAPTLPDELAAQAADAGAPADDVDAGFQWDGPHLAVTAIAAAVYSEPAFDKKKKLGYVRNGGRVPVKPEPVSKKQCRSGWYEVATGGYICGNLGTTDLEHPQVKFAIKAPDVETVLPYQYARNAKNGTPLYKSVPSRDQMAVYEPYLKSAKKKKKKSAKKESKKAASDEPKPTARRVADAGAPTVATSAPRDGGPKTSEQRLATALADAGIALPILADAGQPEAPWWQREDAKERLHEIKLSELNEGADDVLAKRMVEGFYIAIDKPFNWNGRRWYKTTKGLVAPADRFWITAGSKFKGVELDGKKLKLPIGWVYGGRKSAPTYQVDVEAKKAKPDSRVKRFEAIPLTGRTATVRGITYSEAEDGFWVKNIHIRRTKPGAPPADLAPDERWVDVNLKQQTLVAYIGSKPVYATLVSTGKTSTKKEKDHGTPTGQWRVREKHITTTMDGDGTVAGDLPYSIEDVPYVMYYHRSYALHGAFWHRNYGIQMSHGCVNLAPLDAKHLFFFTDPQIPQGWHGTWAAKDRKGSLIVVHE